MRSLKITMTSLVYQHAAVNFIFPTVGTVYVQDTIFIWVNSKKESEYDKEVPQSQTNPGLKVIKPEYSLKVKIKRTD